MLATCLAGNRPDTRRASARRAIRHARSVAAPWPRRDGAAPICESLTLESRRRPLEPPCSDIETHLRHILDNYYVTPTFEQKLAELEPLDRDAEHYRCPDWLRAEIATFTGLVLFEGLHRRAGAKVAFAEALTLDASVRPDPRYATAGACRLFARLLGAEKSRLQHPTLSTPVQDDMLCSIAPACAAEGLCGYDPVWRACAPRSNEDCRRSRVCALHHACTVMELGLCTGAPGHCPLGCWDGPLP